MFTQIKDSMTPYEFDKKIIEECNSKLFKKDDNGHITGIDYKQYAYSASKLLKEMYTLKEKLVA